MFAANNCDITLDVPSAALNRLFGYDSKELVLIGTGTNSAPSGTLVFRATAGWTINGAASASFSALAAPANLVFLHDFATLNTTVVKL